MAENSMLALDALPDLPQAGRLRELAPRLWQADGVVALWVGGSLAAGCADRYSDVDLFVAVTSEAMDRWRDLDMDALFAGLCLAHQFSYFGQDLFVHHILLSSGEVFDLHVQRAEGRFGSAERLVLGCRDPGLRPALEQRSAEVVIELPADGERVQELIEAYWQEAHKHRKVLHRGLDAVAVIGLRMLHLWYLRLAYILATGEDCLDLRRATIHSLTPVVRRLQEAQGGSILEVVGMPVRTRAEICAAIEALNAEVARIGRELARKFSFRYPDALESVVIGQWTAFRQQDGST